MMSERVIIDGKGIGEGYPTYIVAEMSANHNRDIDRAIEIIKEAKRVGADAIKLQTFSPDSLTIRSENPHFRIEKGIWKGYYLHDLYERASMPYEWQRELIGVARNINITLFSTAFDMNGIEFLETLKAPAHKISSFEITDHDLIRKAASTNKPLMLSTGMATIGEIEEAVGVARTAGCSQLILLKCTSSYPAPYEEMHLKTIPHMSETFNTPVGLSDHTIGSAVAIASVTLGACLIEKHFTLDQSDTPDSTFSMEPKEFKELIEAIRIVERSIGEVRYGPSEHEKESLIFRRSLFVVEDVKKGHDFTKRNIRSIRPGYGIDPKNLNIVLGKRASKDIKAGTPFDWTMIE